MLINKSDRGEVMSLADRLLDLISVENKKDPHTDMKLAKMLSTTRENVTAVRKELNIPNSRERRKPYLENALETILSRNDMISISDITKQLMSYGFNISRHIVEEMLKEKKTDNRSTELNSDPFQNLIGYNGSLKTCITQAKAAILYPPLGLPTLIIGESGVGKTQFAETMYKFASQRSALTSNLPFVVFNCADYGDNPQLLLSILYGYKKGAFTGADNDKEGIVETANNGILFLDEIHRLPPKGQEMLFSILDKGTFRRLGETNVERKVNIMLIGATTEDIQSNLLLTFRRRIPMIITIPALEQRSVLEKVQLIQYFFQRECNRINLKIFVEAKVIEIFAVEKFNGNIGELKSKIQVTCARAFMKYINKFDEIINIGTSEIFEITRDYEDINIENSNIIQAKNYVRDMLFVPFVDNEFKSVKYVENDEYSLPKDFYRQIEQKYYELKKSHKDLRDIEKILWQFINKQFKRLQFTDNKSNIFSLDELVTLVDKDILENIRKLRNVMKEKYPNCHFNENVFLYLGIHLQETVNRIKLRKPIINMNLSKIKEELRKEYELALEFSILLGKVKNISIPEDEVGFIALYIKTAIQDKLVKNHVGIIVISHGKIATEIVSVVKELLNINFPVAIDMPLTENPSVTYQKILQVSKKLNEGKGILFLVDMGSLVNVGNMASENLGIDTRTIDRVDLLTVLEAVRKASIPENDLDSIYFSLIKSRYGYYPLPLNIKENDKPPAIISLCLTGKGMAEHISGELSKRYRDVKIFQMGIMEEMISEKIKKLQDSYRIIAIVGTINPEISGINFIPYEPNLFNEELKRIDVFLESKNKNILANVINEDLILFEPCVEHKRKAIELGCSLLVNKGYVDRKFLDCVLQREKISSTFSKGGVALPHGDFSHVIRSSIVFVKLKDPIDWGKGKAQIICLPALKVNDKRIVTGLLKLFLNMNFINTLKEAKDAMNFKNIILEGLKQ